MSLFSRTLRSWHMPQNRYFDTSAYPAYEPHQFQNDYFNINGCPPYEHNQPQHRYWNEFLPDDEYPYGKLGNLDVDGFPTKIQLLSPSDAPDLAENKIFGTYAGQNEYFHTQFGLMEEDFMYQARKAVNEYSLKPGGSLDLRLKQSKGYENVRIKNLKSQTLGKESFTTCVMDFGSESSRYQQPSFGNFLVFFKDGEKTPECVGMVIRDAKNTDEEYSEIRLHFDDEKYDESQLGKHRFYVLEPDSPFFLSYFCIYNALNGLYSSNNFLKFRMAPYILCTSEGVKSPVYLKKQTMYRIYGSEFPILQRSAWPAKPGHLNNSQYTALKRALTEELALVQGPPGTGKTYFGIELVKVLLDDSNISNWNPRRETPLLVICHSNHALDHFLEGIHKFTDKYVRVGLRCQSETIKPKCLVELVCRDIAPKNVQEKNCTCEVVVKKFRKIDWEEEDEDEESDEDSGHGRDDDSEEDEVRICESEHCNREIPSSKCYCMSALRRCLDLIDESRGQLRSLTEGIVHFKTLQYWGVIDEETGRWFEERRPGNGYLKWLGLDNVKVENKNVKRQDSDYLLVNLEELKRRIENLNQRNKRSAKMMNDDKNKIVSIIRKFEQSSREDIFGDASDIFTLTPNDTRKIYVKWLDSLSYRLHRTLCELEKKLYYNFWGELPKRERYDCMLKHLRSAHVVGLTSTGAAARRSTVKTDKNTGEEKFQDGILERLASPIVILEEAAQILESHVIASLTIHCKHLIMLGDHQQLKPCISATHLAAKFLNVSLFERLLSNEVVRQECLTIQNRMRPEIADLLRPHYYANLRDAPPTKNRPSVRGLQYNLFFLDHREPEKKAENGNKGFYNTHEINLLLNLSQFLVTKGYLPSQITIISMYNEQRRRLIEEREKNPLLANLEITSVDGFQGKENEIILLSLVRSNDGGHIGFLDEENRICVALSRARSGLYIMGNMKCLTKHCKMWRYVSERLQGKGAIGPVLNLSCDKHSVTSPLSAQNDWHCFSCLGSRKQRQKKRVRRSKKKSS